MGSDARRGSSPFLAAGLPAPTRNVVPDPTGRVTAFGEPRVLLEHAFLLSNPWDHPGLDPQLVFGSSTAPVYTSPLQYPACLEKELQEQLFSLEGNQYFSRLFCLGSLCGF